ncbi:MAG TPA: RNA-binding S4 domain-containing protein [Prolixibacteraceae bacterium]|jgi:ribosome-associated heat shock protein Hsp15|nr:RNA-binding S4 domain-containing protein [Prolixibacteraceae bacterium]
MTAGVRIDKWLFAVRIFKTRTIATDECNKGRITIEGMNVKPSREVRIGDVIEIRKPPITYKFKVLQLAEKRMGAKLVPEFAEDLTTKEQFEIIEMQRMVQWSGREKGTGRPTKKDRRDMEDFLDW